MKTLPAHGKKSKFFLVLFLFLILFAFIFSKQIKAAVNTTLLLSEYSTVLFDNKVPRPLPALTKTPKFQKITIPSKNGPLEADLYLPGDLKSKNPAVVYVFGLSDVFYGPRLVQSAEAMARIGVVTLVPHLSNFKNRRLIEEGVLDELTDSFTYLENRKFVDPGRIGFVSFCVGSSLALIAASGPAISDRVNFVGAMSPYYDLTSFTQAIFEREYDLDGRKISWKPDPQTVKIARKEFMNIPGLSQEERIKILLAIGGPLSDKEFKSLSEAGKNDWEIFTSGDREKVKTLVDRFWTIYKTSHDEFSPSQNIKNLKAPVYLATALGDRYIPVSESEMLANEMKKNGKEIVFTRSKVLEHTIPGRNIPAMTLIKELFNFWSMTYQMVLRIS